MRRYIFTAVAIMVGLAGAVALAQLGGGGFGGPGATLRGPTSSTDNAIARFNGTTGKVVQNSSGVTINDNNTLSIETLNTPMQQTRHTDTASQGSGIAIRRSRGTTLGGNTIVQDNDVVGNINFQGADGTNFDSVAIIRAEVDGAPSDGTDMPGALLFLTTPDASATAVERMRIDSQGRISSITNTGTAGTGVSILEFGDGFNHVTRIDLGTGVFPSITGDTAQAVGLLVYTFPTGVIYIDAIHMDVAIDGVTAIQGDTPDVGLGTVIASGAVSVLGGTATFEDWINGIAAADANGTNTDTTTIPNVSSLIVLEAGETHAVHFNAADLWDDASGGDSSPDLSGQIWIAWRFLGA